MNDINKVCSCQSGEGSLRHPCPAHPNLAEAQPGGRTVLVDISARGYPIAWMWELADGSATQFTRCGEVAGEAASWGRIVTPLYTQPGGRVRLGDKAERAPWRSMDTCPRDGTVVRLRWGEDHVSPGWWPAPVSPAQNDDGTWPSDTGGFPWAFIDFNNGSAFVNHAVDTEYGPTHWAPYAALSVKPSPGGQDALRAIAERLRAAGASLPAPPITGTIEGSMVTGLSIALALVEEASAARQPVGEPRAFQLAGSEPLWCLHVLGMDDAHPAPSKAHAEKAAAWHNEQFKDQAARLGISIEAKAVPWPHSAESHAAGVAEFIPDWLIPQWQLDALEANAKQPAQAVDLGPRPMETAPRDGTMVRLLVQFEENATEDTPEPAWTIGACNDDNVGEDERIGWQFAGWCWAHDHFTEGKGAPVGWLPLLDSQAVGK